MSTVYAYMLRIFTIVLPKMVISAYQYFIFNLTVVFLRFSTKYITIVVLTTKAS